jgi:hypothetical protein
MGKQKRQIVQRPTPIAVNKGDCFATFLAEAQSIGNEVAARRAFDAEVEAFLKERGLLETFEVWRASRSNDR